MNDQILNSKKTMKNKRQLSALTAGIVAKPMTYDIPNYNKPLEENICTLPNPYL